MERNARRGGSGSSTAIRRSDATRSVRTRQEVSVGARSRPGHPVSNFDATHQRSARSTEVVVPFVSSRSPLPLSTHGGLIDCESSAMRASGHWPMDLPAQPNRHHIRGLGYPDHRASSTYGVCPASTRLETIVAPKKTKLETADRVPMGEEWESFLWPKGHVSSRTSNGGARDGTCP